MTRTADAIIRFVLVQGFSPCYTSRTLFPNHSLSHPPHSCTTKFHAATYQSSSSKVYQALVAPKTLLRRFHLRGRDHDASSTIFTTPRYNTSQAGQQSQKKRDIMSSQYPFDRSAMPNDTSVNLSLLWQPQAGLPSSLHARSRKNAAERSQQEQYAPPRLFQSFSVKRDGHCPCFSPGECTSTCFTIEVDGHTRGLKSSPTSFPIPETAQQAG